MFAGAVAYFQWECDIGWHPKELRPRFASPTTENDFRGGPRALMASCARLQSSYDQKKLRSATTAEREAAFAEALAMHMADISRPKYIFDRAAAHIAMATASFELGTRGWQLKTPAAGAQWEAECRTAMEESLATGLTGFPQIATAIQAHWNHEPDRYGGAYTIIQDWIAKFEMYRRIK